MTSSTRSGGDWASSLRPATRSSRSVPNPLGTHASFVEIEPSPSRGRLITPPGGRIVVSRRFPRRAERRPVAVRVRAHSTAASTRPRSAGAAFAVAVAYEKSSQFGVSDASRATQSMMLTAWEAGVGSGWAGFHGLEAVAEYLGVPDTLAVLAVIGFGYPAEARSGDRKDRKPLAEVASRERYGQPFE